MIDKALSPQDAVDSFDRLRKSQIAFRFASESEAEEWERDGRINDVRHPELSPFPER